MEDKEKRVDESWKEAVEKEKQSTQAYKQNDIPNPDFKLFLSSLGMQALIALGELENPITKKKEIELPQAKYLVDILGVIKEKTKNNLDKAEQDILENLLYQLRTIYITLAKSK